jgi:predicted alpha/beta superfamily hydrolase
VPRDQSIAPRVGGSAPFRAFLRDEVRPAVSARLRVTDESAIIGESLAGLFVVETLLLEPSLFDIYIAVDPSLWWNDSALLRAADELLRTPPRVGKTLFLTAADERANAPFCAQLAAALQRAPAGLQWQFVPRPDLRHDTIFRAMAKVAFGAVLAKR